MTPAFMTETSGSAKLCYELPNLCACRLLMPKQPAARATEESEFAWLDGKAGHVCKSPNQMPARLPAPSSPLQLLETPGGQSQDKAMQKQAGPLDGGMP
jgi:hypothetical protein